MRRARGALFGSELAAAALGFLGSLVAAKVVGLRGFGIYGVAASLAAICSLFLDVRLEELALLRFQRDEASSPSRSSWRGYVWGDAAFEALGVGIMCAGGSVWAWTTGSPYASVFLAYVAASACSGAEPVLRAILNARGDRTVVATARVVGPAASVVGILVLRPSSPVALALITGGSTSFATLVLWARMARFVGSPRALGSFWHDRTEWRRPLLTLSVGSTIGAFTANADQLIVAGILGPERAGVYRLARSIASTPGVAASAIRFVLAPDLFAAAVSPRRSGVREILVRMSAASVIVGVLVLVAWLALGSMILDRMGPQFSAVHVVATMLLLAAIVDVATVWSKVLPVALERMHWAILDAVGSAVATAIAITAGAASAGVTGAAFGRLLAALLSTTVWALAAAALTRQRVAPDR